MQKRVRSNNSSNHLTYYFTSNDEHSVSRGRPVSFCHSCLQWSVAFEPGRLVSQDSVMGEYTRTGAGVPNLFGLTQFDGKTQFFDDSSHALPQVCLKLLMSSLKREALHTCTCNYYRLLPKGDLNCTASFRQTTGVYTLHTPLNAAFGTMKLLRCACLACWWYLWSAVDAIQLMLSITVLCAFRLLLQRDSDCFSVTLRACVAFWAILCHAEHSAPLSRNSLHMLPVNLLILLLCPGRWLGHRLWLWSVLCGSCSSLGVD